MENKGVLYRFVHFVVHNSFLFTVVFMCLDHMLLLGVMIYADIVPLVWFNILSVIVYISCILLCKWGHHLPVYISILLEVSTYSVLSTHYAGWDCGACYFVCSIVPLIIYFGFFLFKGRNRLIVAVLLVADFALYLIMYFMYRDKAGVFDISNTVQTALFIIASFTMVFSIIFYNIMYICAAEFKELSLERVNEQLSFDASVDSLTGLLNRRGFLPVVENLMDGETENHFCIAFCDIDDFKQVNDRYGHDGGDEVLRHVAFMLKREMSGCEICRWGGEELVILMRDYDFAVAKHKMEYIRKSVEQNHTVFYNKHIPVTITIGLEEYSDSYSKADDIIKVADERMYYGKQHGKNVLVFKDECSVAS